MRIERIGDAVLYLGRCEDVLPTLDLSTAIVSDPPYGMGYDPRRSQSSAASGRRKKIERIEGDDKEFDPSPLLMFKETILWGANNYPRCLPSSNGWLVWDKRMGGQLFKGFVASDVELAFTNLFGTCRTFCHAWCGHFRDSERDSYVHPTQKPIALMEWCVGFTSSDTIADPYMGSGTTGIAAIRSGRKFIGVEIAPAHFETACRRIEDEWRKPRLFADAPQPKPVQAALL